MGTVHQNVALIFLCFNIFNCQCAIFSYNCRYLVYLSPNNSTNCFWIICKFIRFFYQIPKNFHFSLDLRRKALYNNTVRKFALKQNVATSYVCVGMEGTSAEHVVAKTKAISCKNRRLSQETYYGNLGLYNGVFRNTRTRFKTCQGIS